MKKKTLTILSSCAAIAVCSSLIVGSTYALFTSEDNVNIAVTAGSVSVSAEIGELSAYSKGALQENGTWYNGGSATVDGNKIALENITPGDSVEIPVSIINYSNVNILYNVNVVLGEDKLAGGLEVSVSGDEQTYENIVSYTSDWTEYKEGATVTVTVSLPWEAGNEYQELSTSISLAVTAVQANGAEAGTGKDVRYSGYTYVSTAEELAAAVANGGKVGLASDIEVDDTFSIKVTNDAVIDLGEKELKGTTSSIAFMVNGATLTLKNGDLGLKRCTNAQYVICVYPNSTVNLDGVNMKTNYYGMLVYGNGATVNIKNSKIETEESAAVTSNASLVYNPGFTVNIEGSTIIGGQTGLLLNVPCTVNITNSKIDAKYQGILARGGTYTITDSTISNTNYDAVDVNKFDNTNWGSGNSANRAALTIGNKGGSDNYQYPTVVTLINTRLESVGVYPIVYMYGNTSEGNGATLIYDNDCTFTYTDNTTYEQAIILGDDGANTTVTKSN